MWPQTMRPAADNFEPQQERSDRSMEYFAPTLQNCVNTHQNRDLTQLDRVNRPKRRA